MGPGGAWGNVSVALRTATAGDVYVLAAAGDAVSDMLRRDGFTLRNDSDLQKMHYTDDKLTGVRLWSKGVKAAERVQLPETAHSWVGAMLLIPPE